MVDRAGVATEHEREGGTADVHVEDTHGVTKGRQGEGELGGYR